MKPPLYPAPLKKGDTIGIIAPAGQLQDKQLFIKGINVLQEMGFQVNFPRDLWPGEEYLSDSDENRGLEFNRLIGDKETKALIAMRGGYGCLRMLEKIDLDLVSRNPKILVGFSDITILQNYLRDTTGLVSLHGPVVTSLVHGNRETLSSFHHCLTAIRTCTIKTKNMEILRPGKDVTAPIIGGNLSSVVTLLGTLFDFSWDNKILFLEDTNEPVYKIDRMLTQLKLAGKFDHVAGIVLGDFSISSIDNQTDRIRYLESVWIRVLDLCPNPEIPIWGNFPAGHCPCNLTFPLGALAEMKKSNYCLNFK